jgi:hypothetical protein
MTQAIFGLAARVIRDELSFYRTSIAVAVKNKKWNSSMSQQR